MEKRNHLLVQKGLSILHGVLAPWICGRLRIARGEAWWPEGVLGVLDERQIMDLPATGPDERLMASLDLQRCLWLLDRHWGALFRRMLDQKYRSWGKETLAVRNECAHIGMDDMAEEDARRALDTMTLMCRPLAPERAEDLRALVRELLYGSADGSAAAPVPVPPPAPADPAGTRDAPDPDMPPAPSIPSWRDVAVPHPDVTGGRWRNADFAADLGRAARGEGPVEYSDPAEFFNRTYVTAGMRALLVRALRRASSGEGDPVIQLRTAFGGGKTHSMLALLHLLGGEAPLGRIPALGPILEEAGLAAPPRMRVAAAVGTALNPAKGRIAPGSSIRTRTLCGDIAAQLAAAAGRAELFETLIRDADRKGVSPGADALRELLDACGPCLVLIDELVAYARQLVGARDLPAGTFDALMTSMQSLTEAVNGSANGLLVVSVPESETEIGGEGGRKALDAMSRIFGRQEAVWNPVTAEEGFEVVRRRLFRPCADEGARDRACEAFARMYREHPGLFPRAASEPDYLRRLRACHPIHPEVFDRIYGAWGSLETFQRTRGVLRLMAAVIHSLWMSGDTSALILPGSLPAAGEGVRGEFLRHLPGWDPIMDREVDGSSSLPWALDEEHPRFGRTWTARRAARTIFLGSAPQAAPGGDSGRRGLEISEIRLGTALPGEDPGVIDDVMGLLGDRLSYLYDEGGRRFWFDTRPTLRRLMEDRARDADPRQVDAAIRDMLRLEPMHGLIFDNRHICPEDPGDVPDDDVARLVFLPPDQSEPLAGEEDSPARRAAARILECRNGGAPRENRNMLVFVAPERDAIEGMRAEMRRKMAWTSLRDARDTLNLGAREVREVKEAIARSTEILQKTLPRAWSLMLTPRVDWRTPSAPMEWRARSFDNTDTRMVERLNGITRRDGLLAIKWGGDSLLLELDRIIWKDADSISAGRLWRMLRSYYYMQRLASYGSLEGAIRECVNGGRLVLAGRRDDEGAWMDVRRSVAGGIDPSWFLVRPEAVPAPPAEDDGEKEKRRREEERKRREEEDRREKLPTIFHMSAGMDYDRIHGSLRKLDEEILAALNAAPGVELRIRLDVVARTGEGFSADVVRAVRDNCRALHVDDADFDRE